MILGKYFIVDYISFFSYNRMYFRDLVKYVENMCFIFFRFIEYIFVLMDFFFNLNIGNFFV